MIRVKPDIDLLDLLARCGFNSYQLRRQHIFGQRTIQKLRNKGLPSWGELDTICSITNYDIGELIEYIRDQEPTAGG